MLYAVLALAAFAFPGGMVDWLDERNADGWLAAPLAIARGVDAASAAVGVKRSGRRCAMVRRRRGRRQNLEQRVAPLRAGNGETPNGHLRFAP